MNSIARGSFANALWQWTRNFQTKPPQPTLLQLFPVLQESMDDGSLRDEHATIIRSLPSTAGSTFIDGGPGSGKSTLCTAICREILKKGGRIAWITPSNALVQDAYNRLSKAIPDKTIRRVMPWEAELHALTTLPRQLASFEVDFVLVIVDEASRLTEAQSVISLTKCPRARVIKNNQAKIQHIDIRYKWIIDRTDKSNFRLAQVGTEEMTTDDLINASQYGSLKDSNPPVLDDSTTPEHEDPPSNNTDNCRPAQGAHQRWNAATLPRDSSLLDAVSPAALQGCIPLALTRPHCSDISLVVVSDAYSEELRDGSDQNKIAFWCSSGSSQDAKRIGAVLRLGIKEMWPPSDDPDAPLKKSLFNEFLVGQGAWNSLTCGTNTSPSSQPARVPVVDVFADVASNVTDACFVNILHSDRESVRKYFSNSAWAWALTSPRPLAAVVNHT
ncbi:hypothetical protein AUP68_03275 [Ilyonectria robusta]